MSRGQVGTIPVYKAKARAPCGPVGEEAPIVVVGAGPVGLTAALDLGRRGHKVIVLNQLDFIAAGSKAICFSHRTLNIWNRLGVARRMVEKGVIWNRGKVFRGARPEPIYEFDMRAFKDQEMPGFINLQQYHAEDFLADALAQLDTVEIRWGHRLTAFDADTRTLEIDAGDEGYRLKAGWVLACDGSRSALRSMMGLDFDGRVFEDNFLIADVRFEEERPAERWFWFDPPWGGDSALLHKQPDNVWRLDFQLGQDIDKEAAASPEAVTKRVRNMIGADTAFELVWVSVYTFQCRRMARFIHGPVVFLGDSAHLVSPFGARGCNGGIADVDNLCWKLDAVLKEEAPRALLESYEIEAGLTADENILNSTRSTDFMVPRSAPAKALRDAVLDLAPTCPFARPFVNSGRLSTPVSFPSSPLTTPDRDIWSGGVPPGSPAVDAPLASAWLLGQLGGTWQLLASAPIADAPLQVVVLDTQAARARYDLESGSAYLLRPDQYVAARWKAFHLADLEETSWRA